MLHDLEAATYILLQMLDFVALEQNLVRVIIAIQLHIYLVAFKCQIQNKS